MGDFFNTIGGIIAGITAAAPIVWIILKKVIINPIKVVSKLAETLERIENTLAVIKSSNKAIIASSEIPYYETDALGHCLFVSKAWVELTGISPEEAMGNGWINAVHPDDRDRVFKEWESSIKQDRDFSLEYRVGHGDKYLSITGRSSPVRNASKKTVGHIGILFPQE